LIPFIAAIQFLLLSPAFIRRPFTPRELGRATAFYPVVGLVLGAVLAGADALLGRIFLLPLRSALVLAIWIILTGALHFDGFLDSLDGLLGGSTPERRMEIMRDERTGAFALAGGVLLLLIMFSSLGQIAHARWEALILAPVLGRWGMSLAVVLFPYGRAEGLGRDIKDHAGATQATIATVVAVVLTAVAGWEMGSFAPAVALVAAVLVGWLSSRFILHWIPGMTGDSYGALNMLMEAAVLLTFAGMQ
jgi:adenosylcobinamide-GDP ribazoletransferase